MEFPTRRTSRSATYTYVDEGRVAQLRANGQGLVKPRTAKEAALLDSFGLPLVKGGNKE